MSVPGPRGYALNRTRNAYLATHLRLAATHWSRLCGLIATDPAHFPVGEGLWIVPCHGVHTFAMRFPIDVLYVVARHVFTVLSEFDGKAVIWAFVHAGEVALDDQTSLQLQAAHFGEDERVQIFLWIVHVRHDLRIILVSPAEGRG